MEWIRPSPFRPGSRSHPEGRRDTGRSVQLYGPLTDSNSERRQEGSGIAAQGFPALDAPEKIV